MSLPPAALTALGRRAWMRRLVLPMLWVAALLPGLASAEAVSLDKLPLINQHNALFDRNAQDGNQNGEFWCAPVATVSALLWLADRYDRPDIVPRDAAGQRYSTEAFVRYLGERWFNTNDRAGTGEQQWQLGLWGYLQTTPYRWRMEVFVTPGRLTEIDGPDYADHASVRDLFGQMHGSDDEVAGVVLMAYQHTDALGQLVKHATVLQQLADEQDLARRYPGKIMDPFFGRLDDIEFEATAGLASSANLWDAIAWRDVYLAMSIAPASEPGALPLLALALSMLAVVRARRRPARRT